MNARDAVLPFGPGRPTQEVRGTRLGDERGAIPSALSLPPQPEHARRQEGDADHLPEHGLVLVPPDCCPRSVFGEENVRQLRRRYPGERRGPFPQWNQEGRNIFGPAQPPRVEVVLPAE